MIYYFGSAFNPITLAHQEILDKIISKVNGYKDVVVIGVTTYNYQDLEFESGIRYEMAFQYMSKKYGVTINWKVYYQFAKTWEYLHKIFKEEEQHNICLVIGQDEYDDLKEGKWEHSEDILNTYQIKVIPRTNNISSSKVRDLFESNNDIKFEDVQEFITKDIYEFLSIYYKQREKNENENCINIDNETNKGE